MPVTRVLTFLFGGLLLGCGLLADRQANVALGPAGPADAAERFEPEIPRTWDAEAMSDFMVHVPDSMVHVQPISEEYYYRLPVRTIWKTYPVYHPDHEPEGYLDSLRQLEPEMVFEASQLRTAADWIEAGEHVFDAPHLFIPIESVFGPRGLAENDIRTTPEGIFPYVKYVVRERGAVELGVAACADCHSRVMDDGSVIKGAQGNFNVDRLRAAGARRAGQSERVDSVLRRSDLELFGAPWVRHASQDELDTLTAAGFAAAHASMPDGVFARQGTGLRYPVRIPDLRGVRHQKYLDATGHMRNRGLGDVMRYAAFNENVDMLTRYDDWIPVLGEHQGPLPPPTDSLYSEFNGPFDRFTDEQLYALALYIYSLEPLPSPHVYDDATVARGEYVFIEEGCVTCHEPPHYTNNQLTPVLSFFPPDEHLERLDVFDISVETDPGLSLYTRRATGYYKVPSLRGLWYRSPLFHDGSLTTLEEVLDPARLEDAFVPTGFKPVGAEARPVKGHPFGFELSEDDKSALIAYLNTL